MAAEEASLQAQIDGYVNAPGTSTPAADAASNDQTIENAVEQLNAASTDAAAQPGVARDGEVLDALGPPERVVVAHLAVAVELARDAVEQRGLRHPRGAEESRVEVAQPQPELPVGHQLAGLAPGESADVSGEVRVPLNQLRPITQGRAQLFVPLARFRIGALGQEPRCFTLVTGQPSPSGNGAIQPIRLDHGPRIYDGLAGRAF